MTSLYKALIKPVQCGALFSVYCRGYTFSRCVHIPKGIYEPITALHCIALPFSCLISAVYLGRKKEELKSVKLREPCGELKPRCPERSSPHMVLTAATANRVPSFKHPRLIGLGKATTASAKRPLTRLATPLHYGHACPGICSLRSCNAEGVLSRLAVSVWRVWLRGVKSLISKGVISQLSFQLRDYEDSRGKTHEMYELNYDDPHHATSQLTRKYLSDLEEFGKVPFEMAPSDTAGSVQSVRIAYLNKRHASTA